MLCYYCQRNQKREGGKPDNCIVYELFLYHLIDDDSELEDIYRSCINGEQMCGNCKRYAAELMEKMLTDLQEKRDRSEEVIDEYIF